MEESLIVWMRYISPSKHRNRQAHCTRTASALCNACISTSFTGDFNWARRSWKSSKQPTSHIVDISSMAFIRPQPRRCYGKKLRKQRRRGPSIRTSRARLRVQRISATGLCMLLMETRPKQSLDHGILKG